MLRGWGGMRGWMPGTRILQARKGGRCEVRGITGEGTGTDSEEQVQGKTQGTDRGGHTTATRTGNIGEGTVETRQGNMLGSATLTTSENQINHACNLQSP